MNIGAIAKLFGIDADDLKRQGEEVVSMFVRTTTHFDAQLNRVLAELKETREALARLENARAITHNKGNDDGAE